MPLTPFIQAIAAEIEAINYGQHPNELYEPIRYIMALGGKRIRPLLTVLTANLFIDDWQKAIKPAIAVEVFHNFTLMHDDIMDNAPLRRGKATVHEKWNSNIAILSGDVMLVNAYELLLDVAPHQLATILRRFNRTAAEVCEGQQLDMNFEKLGNVSVDDYLEMIRLKTSVLLGFAMELGGMIGGADLEISQELYHAGVNMGIAFQLKDDLLDVYGDPEKFGKQVGGDIISNKKTFLLIEAQKRATGSDLAALNRWLSMKEFDRTEKVLAVRALYDKLGIRELTETKIQAFFSTGYQGLENIEADATKKKLLLGLSMNLIGRES